MCTPWDSDSIVILEELGVQAYKVASADLTNLPLIENLIATQKPLILSTGMSSVEEIEITTTSSILKVPSLLFYTVIALTLLHSMILILTGLKSLGYSSFDWLFWSRKRDCSDIGCSRSWCKVVERHFTFDRSMEGPDHAASLERMSLKRLSQVSERSKRPWVMGLRGPSRRVK